MTQKSFIFIVLVALIGVLVLYPDKTMKEVVDRDDISNVSIEHLNKVDRAGADVPNRMKENLGTLDLYRQEANREPDEWEKKFPFRKVAATNGELFDKQLIADAKWAIWGDRPVSEIDFDRSILPSGENEGAYLARMADAARLYSFFENEARLSEGYEKVCKLLWQADKGKTIELTVDVFEGLCLYYGSYPVTDEIIARARKLGFKDDSEATEQSLKKFFRGRVEAKIYHSGNRTVEPTPDFAGSFEPPELSIPEVKILTDRILDATSVEDFACYLGTRPFIDNSLGYDDIADGTPVIIDQPLDLDLVRAELLESN